MVGVVLTLAPTPDASSAMIAANVAFADLPNGRGGTNVEAIVYTEQMEFDKERSLAVRLVVRMSITTRSY